MLAKPDGGRLREGSQWTYEYKLDGYRACMRIAPDGTTVFTSRNGIDFSAEFPELLTVFGDALDGRAAVLDGEIVVYNEHGRADFGLMQDRRGRFQKHRTLRPDEPFEDVPVRLLVFDLLRWGDRSLLDRPYDERRRLLTGLPMPDPYRIAVVRAVTFDELAADRLTPQDMLARTQAAGYEGLVAKLRSSPYLPGKRPDSWLKHPLVHTQEVIICGWRPGQHGFTGRLGGLLLGAHDPDTGDLVYIGDVGTGFSEQDRHDLQARLQPLERRRHPFVTTPPREDTVRARWVRPELVGEVQYRQFTRGAGRLRHTSWRGLRADRTPDEVVAPRPFSPDPQPARESNRVTVRAGNRKLVLSNLDKALYPNGFTKAQVIDYYSRIAPVMLPHIHGRPVTFIRFPDGVEGESFFEKNVPLGAPDWLPTVVLPSSGSRGSGDTIRYALLEELPALVWSANMAALELHVPQWTVAGGRDAPDRLVFDLDPGPGTTIVDCCRVAERLGDLLEADGLTPFATTSGGKGMQLYCAIETDNRDRPSRYAKALAQKLARETPGRITATMAKTHRTGKVFIDWSQNNTAKTTIAPYSLRGREQPTAATPVTWDEVRGCRRPAQLVFTSADVLDRVAGSGDLFGDLADSRARLPGPV
ncbi:DNA ligase D [Actinocrispum sp. NPDC049592]|uniref:DNA ligase D n=1 Tax=Actinocrispum sp. NPDC049592 TaxID=3154835 RepID=UPI00341E89DD